MKKITVFLCVLCAAVLGCATLASAALQDNGGGLIYDTDLNITWYAYSNGPAHWETQVSWAASLTVGGVTGWRLPSTVDGPKVYGYDGTTTYGYNITTSELGHLYYTELHNKGYVDVNGNSQPDGGLVNKGPFTDLQAWFYWSGTEYSSDTNLAWIFNFVNGEQWEPLSKC